MNDSTVCLQKEPHRLMMRASKGVHIVAFAPVSYHIGRALHLGWREREAPRNSSKGGGAYGRDGAAIRRSPPLECAIRLTSLPSANSGESRLGLRLRTACAAKALEQISDVRALSCPPPPFPFVTYITQQLRQHCGNGDLDARILGKCCHFVYPARSHRHAAWHLHIYTVGLRFSFSDNRLSLFCTERSCAAFIFWWGGKGALWIWVGGCAEYAQLCAGAWGKEIRLPQYWTWKDFKRHCKSNTFMKKLGSV